MQKLLIADVSEEFALSLSEALADRYEIRVCHRGGEVMPLLRSFQPQLLVLDMMLPELDGISLLQQAEKEGICPTVLAISRFFNDYVVSSLETLGVGYAMRKPCDIQATVSRLNDLAGLPEKQAGVPQDPVARVSETLLRLGIPCSFKGYASLREAVLMMLRDRECSVTKEIYPRVGAMTGGNSSQTERAIRAAIVKGWNNRDREVWDRYIPGCDGRCPTNKEFICLVADYLRRE